MPRPLYETVFICGTAFGLSASAGIPVAGGAGRL